MKRSLLALGASAVALSSMALAPSVKVAEGAPFFFDASQQKETQAVAGRPEVATDLQRPVNGIMKAPSKVNCSASDIIYEAEGRLQEITTRTAGPYLFYGISGQTYKTTDQASHMIYGDNNEVYIYNMFPKFCAVPFTDGTGTDTYVKGTIKGDKIVIDLPQAVWVNPDSKEVYDLVYMKQGEILYEGEYVETYVYDESVTSVELIYDAEDGSFGFQYPGMPYGELPMDGMLGLVFDSDKWWTSYGLWEFSATEFNDVLVTPSSNCSMMPADYWYYNNGAYAYAINGWAYGVDADYFQGLSDYMPEAWVKATKDPSDPFTYKIAQNQYIGIYQGHHVWTKCAKFEFNSEGKVVAAELMPDDYEYEVVWDPTGKPETISAKDKDVYLIYNVDTKDRVYMMDAFLDFRLIHRTDFSGTPKTPEKAMYFLPVGGGLGTDYGVFEIFGGALSTDNLPIDPECLYYEVYLDGELWEFEPDLYEGLESPITLIPWTLNLSSMYNPEPAVHVVNIFVEGFETIEAELVYKYDGVETRSGRVGGKVSNTHYYTEWSEVEGVQTDKNVQNVKYYDLSGREVANPAGGIFVKRVIFEDGTSTTSKVAKK